VSQYPARLSFDLKVGTHRASVLAAAKEMGLSVRHVSAYTFEVEVRSAIQAYNFGRACFPTVPTILKTRAIDLEDP
jgi:hypothetical protein